MNPDATGIYPLLGQSIENRLGNIQSHAGARRGRWYQGVIEGYVY